MDEIKMEDIKMHNTGRKMPYTPPNDGFFEEFTESTLREISRRERRRGVAQRAVTATLAAAAMVSAVLWVSVDSESADLEQREQGCIVDNFSSSVSTYAAELSDCEIQALLTDTESEDIFYSNL